MRSAFATFTVLALLFCASTSTANCPGVDCDSFDAPTMLASLTPAGSIHEPASARTTPAADPTDRAQVWVDVGLGITDYEAQSTDEVVSLGASVAARFGHGVIVARGTVAVPLLEERFDEVALLGGLYLEGHHVWLLAAAGIGRASGSIGGELGEELLLDSRRDWGPVVAPALEIRVGTTQVWPLGLNVFANLNDESQMIGAHLSVRFRVR